MSVIRIKSQYYTPTKIDKEQSHITCPFYTLKEAAAYLRLHPMTLYRMIKRKEIAHFRVGGAYRIPKDIVERMMRDK